MTNPDYDPIAELADRMVAKSRLDDVTDVLEVEWGSLLPNERAELLVLLRQQLAHRKEKLEGIESNVRVLKALLVLQVDRAPGMSLTEAIGSGRIGILELIEAVRLADRVQ